MSYGEADTWDPEFDGADGGASQQAPTGGAPSAPVSNDRMPLRPQAVPGYPMLLRPHQDHDLSMDGQQQWILHEPRGQSPGGQYQTADSQSSGASWHGPRGSGQSPSFGSGAQAPAPQYGQPKHSYSIAWEQGQRGRGLHDNGSSEHYRDCGVLPWWAWAGIGAVVITCGLLAMAGLSPSTLDPNRSTGFDPRLNEDYADMELLGADALFEGVADNVPWELTVSDVDWNATQQVSVQTSMPAPSSGMKYIGVELDLSSDSRNTTPVDEAFLFYYLTPGGQDYSEHYCGDGCLSDDETAGYKYDGWIYFEVPESVPEGGHLRINLLYSGETDTLMELQ